MPVVSVGQLTITDVNDGINLVLSNESHNIPTDAAGNSPVFTGAVSTAKVFAGGVDVTNEWTITVITSVGLTGTFNASTNTYTVSGLTSDVGTVDFNATKPGAGIISSRFTVTKSKKGDQGLHGLSIVLSNESHTLPANSSGVVSSYANSGTTIRVYEGTVELNAISGAGSNGSFAVGTITQSPTSTITVGTITYSGKVATVPVYSAMANGTDSVTISFPITIRRANGTTVTVTRTQTLTKSKQGGVGPVGPVGPRGSVHLHKLITESVWSNDEANALFGASSEHGLLRIADRVTLFNNSAGFSQTRAWTGSTWALQTEVLDGNLLVTDSVTSSAINTQSLYAQDAEITGSFRVINGENTVQFGGDTLIRAQAGNEVLFSVPKSGRGFVQGGGIAPGSILPEALSSDAISRIRSELGGLLPTSGGTQSRNSSLISGTYPLSEIISNNKTIELSFSYLGSSSFSSSNARPSITILVRRGSTTLDTKTYTGTNVRVSANLNVHVLPNIDWKMLDTNPGVGSLIYSVAVTVNNYPGLNPGNFTFLATQEATGGEVAAKWDLISGKPATATRWPTFGEVTGKPTTFTPSAHTHTATQVGLGNVANVRQVEAGTGTGQGTNAVRIGWCSSGADTLRLTVDNTNFGDNWPISVTGNAVTATRLQNARTINGTSFNGSANISTANWGTARTLTIGSTGKSVNGSGNVSWSLAEIGAPSLTGAGASGTWGISVSGNAATVTNGVYTTGNQSIAGNKTFTGPVEVPQLKVTSGNGIGLGAANPTSSYNINMDDTFSPNGTRAAIYSVARISDGTLTGSRTNYGFYNLLLNSYVSDDTFNLTQRASHNEIRNSPTAGGNGFLNTAVGNYNYILQQANGAGDLGRIAIAHGTYNHILNNQANGIVTTAHGTYNYLYASAGSMGTAFGTYNYIRGVVTTNAYGLYLRNDSTGAGTKWGIFSTGDQRNYLNGDLGIGTSSPTSKLHVVGDIRATGSFIGNLTGNADTVTNGVYTVGNQTIGGRKEFTGKVEVRGGSSAPDLIVRRTNNSQNANILFSTTASEEVYAGQGDLGFFNVGNSADNRYIVASVFRVNTRNGDVDFKGVLSGNGSGLTGVNADTVTNGVYTVGNQTIGGTKTFSSAVVLGAQATGTTHAVRADRTLQLQVAAGGGLAITGSGTSAQNLTANRSWTLALDSTVVRTSGDQTIGGTKTFNGQIIATHSNGSTNTATSSYPLRIRNSSWSGSQVTGLEFWNGANKNVAASRIVSQMAGSGGDGERLMFQVQAPSSNPNPNQTQPITRLTVENNGDIIVFDRMFDRNGIRFMKWSDFTPNMFLTQEFMDASGLTLTQFDGLTASFIAAGVLGANLIATNGFNVVSSPDDPVKRKFTLYPGLANGSIGQGKLFHFREVDSAGNDGEDIFYIDTQGEGYFKGSLARGNVDSKAISDSAKRSINPYYTGDPDAASWTGNVRIGNGGVTSANLSIGNANQTPLRPDERVTITFEIRDQFSESSDSEFDQRFSDSIYSLRLQRRVGTGSWVNVPDQLTQFVLRGINTEPYETNGPDGLPEWVGIYARGFSYNRRIEFIDAGGSASGRTSDLTNVQYRIAVSRIFTGVGTAAGVRFRSIEVEKDAFIKNVLEESGAAGTNFGTGTDTSSVLFIDKETGYATFSGQVRRTGSGEVVVAFPRAFSRVHSCVLGFSRGTEVWNRFPPRYRNLTRTGVTINFTDPNTEQLNTASFTVTGVIEL